MIGQAWRMISGLKNGAGSVHQARRHAKRVSTQRAEEHHREEQHEVGGGAHHQRRGVA